MPRTRRVVVPHCAYHVMQHGCDGEPVFFCADDYRTYLIKLREQQAAHDCRVHAYCLLPDRVHLLLGVGADAGALSHAMKQLASRHSLYMQHRYGLTGRLWDERFRSSPVAPMYMSPVARFMEQKPVRECLAQAPEEYSWSSCRQRLGKEPAWIVPEYSLRSQDSTARGSAHYYAKYLMQPVPEEERALIRKAIHGARVIGDLNFVGILEEATGLALARKPRGRPPAQLRKSTEHEKEPEEQA